MVLSPSLAAARLTLVRRRTRDVLGLPALDPRQREAVEGASVGGSMAIIGAPGTGKTTTLVEAVAARVECERLSASDVLVLAPTRTGAAALRDALAARLAGRGIIARTPASAAFGLVALQAREHGEPPPILVTGPEQDAVLAELLAGHQLGLGRPPKWPLPERTVVLRGFRDELRNLIMRAMERGVTPEVLATWADRLGVPLWRCAASVYREYLDVMTLGELTPDAPTRYDPAGLVAAAADLLAGGDDGLPQWRFVAVDDYHDLTVAGVSLVTAAYRRGAEVILAGDPDAAVQGFRGGVPSAVRLSWQEPDLLSVGCFNARRVVLETAWRHGPRLRAQVRAVTDRIGVLGVAEHRRALPGRVLGDQRDEVATAIYRSPAREVAGLARFLRDRHLRAGVPWGDMAVIVRVGGQLERLRQGLESASVPIAAAASELPLRAHPLVRPLLIIAEWSVGEPVDVEAVVEVLTSAIGRADAIAVRRLRQALRAEEQAGGGARASDELLVEAVADPAHVASLPDDVARPAARVGRVFAAGRAAAGASIDELLWAMWSMTGLAEELRSDALAGGVAGGRADRDLDAVMALFDAAGRFAERFPGAPARVFLDRLKAQTLRSDTLAEHAPRHDAVALLTVAAAAGREWDTVAVAGVQEGAWPDLRVRDSLLGAGRLADLVDGRLTGDDVAARPESGGATGAHARERTSVLMDELRLFGVALSRARSEVIVTAVRDADLEPSPFLTELILPADAHGAPSAQAGTRVSESPDVRSSAVASTPPADPADGSSVVGEVATVPDSFDLRGLVGHLRSVLTNPGPDTDTDTDTDVRRADVHEAARVLAHLAVARVPGARPSQWYGLAPVSSVEPLWPSGPVPVSPSKIGAFTECGLKWMLEAAGGTSGETTGQAVGSLIHQIAAAHPSGGKDELLAALDEQWPALGFGSGWLAKRERRRAESMIDVLAGYLCKNPDYAAVEASFDVRIGRGRVRGQIDRVEWAGRDAVRVVDFKTGRTARTAAEAEVDPQLGAYQAAVAADGLGLGVTRTVGAALVYLGGDRRRFAEREQPPFDAAPDPQWAQKLIDEVSNGMAGAEFTASVNSLCRRCSLRASCPAQPSGRAVTS